jgi:hypothetical protein
MNHAVCQQIVISRIGSERVDGPTKRVLPEHVAVRLRTKEITEPEIGALPGHQTGSTVDKVRHGELGVRGSKVQEYFWAILDERVEIHVMPSPPGEHDPRVVRRKARPPGPGERRE